MERLDSLSLIALTSRRSGIKVDRISLFASRWISDFMVDSSFPMEALLLIRIASNLVQKNPTSLSRNGAYPKFQTMPPPGYPEWVEARVDG